MELNKTVELVNEWGRFAQDHPDAGIENFCRYYLTHNREKPREGAIVGGMEPPNKKILLLKVMGRIVRLFLMYADKAKEKTGLKQFEDFNILNTTFHLGEPRKTELIYASLNELSTGIDAINRLKDMGLLAEKDDPADKRSKRVSITGEGKELLFKCYQVFGRLNDMMLNDMKDDDIFLCIQMLKGVEIKFSGLWQQHKDKSFEEVYEEIMGKD